MAATVHFRLTPALEEALDRKITQMQEGGLPGRVATRSAICRAIIGDSLGVPRDTLIADEVLNQAYALSRAACEQALHLTMQNVEKIVDSAVDALTAEG